MFKNMLRSGVIATSVMLASPMLLTTTTAYANTNAVNPAQNLNKILSNMKSMSASFTQTTTVANNKGVKGKKSFSGTMAVQRPNNFRWHTTGNDEQLIVANGSTLWVYDKGLSQATRQNVSNKIGDTPALLLSGDPAKISASFKVTQPNASKQEFVLHPNNSNANFKTLTLAFQSGTLVTMVLNDNLGQTTTIKFSNVKRNVSIPANQFSFTPPKGVDVIDQ